MRLLSWNLLRNRGATAADIARLIRVHRPDLVLMQEATATIDTLVDEAGGTLHRRAMARRSHGPAVWSPHAPRTEAVTLPAGHRLDAPPAVRRLLAPRLALVARLGSFACASVHLDHGQWANRRQLRHLLAAVPDLAVVIGDFNAIGPTPLAGFTDGGPRGASYRGWGVVPFRLDRCLARGWRIDEATMLDRGRSDHRPIIVTLRPA